MTSVAHKNGLPDAEAALAALAESMRGAVAYDANLVGIYSGGAWLAERLAALLPGEHPVGYIDVSFYRDDYAKKGLRAKVETTTLPFEVGGSRIVLVDDVLYTGRSVRAAINELFDYGRPEAIELAVLIDRGGRELPIEATYVGVRVAVARNLSVVLSRHLDGRFELSVEPAGSATRASSAAQRDAANSRICSRSRLPAEVIGRILDTAVPFVSIAERDVKKVPLLRGKTVFNLFSKAHAHAHAPSRLPPSGCRRRHQSEHRRFVDEQGARRCSTRSTTWLR